MLNGDKERVYRALHREWELKQSVGSAGTTRFESLLRFADLDGEVPPALRREVFELGNVRTVLLHRGGVVDEAFVAACPWYDVAEGSEVPLDHHKFEEYSFAVFHYVALIRERLAATLGGEKQTV